MTNNFWKGETYAIVKAMKTTGNREGVIAEWKRKVEFWANGRVNDPDAVAVRAWLPFWRVSPVYTAEELAPIWQALAIAIGHTDKWPPVLKSAIRLEFELDYAGLPRLGCYPEFNIDLTHKYRQFFIVERLHHWSRASAEEIENAFCR